MLPLLFNNTSNHTTMKTITLIKQYLLLLMLGVFIMSCTSDDEPPVVTDETPEEETMDPVDPDATNLDLTFTLHTQQDQIG
ncbi:MAG: PBP1b-binding outer membrane lipoprotein LpoB, partial [Dokdonia sp.]